VSDAERRVVRTPDGRDLDVLLAGPPDGRALVFHDGTPTAAEPFPQLTEPAARLGLRTISWSRPGYAGSTPQPGRTVADVVSDGRAVLDELDVVDYVVLGWSGGGPHALAHAALDPDGCHAAATLGGVAPHDGVGFDWLAGMGEENIAEFGAAVAGEASLVEFLTDALSGLADIRPDGLAAGLGDLVDDVDRAVLHGDYAEHLAAGMRRAVSSGMAGWRDDDLAFVQPWGFDLAAITVPVEVWQGGHDRMVPAEHGRWLATAIPSATAHLDAGEGHLSFVERLPEILGGLRFRD
jgi:pimeloyl-ACP methyl ester carboxylesterase